MMTGQLQLTGPDLALIMRALGKIPLEESFDLFVKLQQHIVQNQPAPTGAVEPSIRPPKSEALTPQKAIYDDETGITTYPDGRTHNRHTGEIVHPDGSRGHDMVLRRNEDTEHLWNDFPKTEKEVAK